MFDSASDLRSFYIWRKVQTSFTKVRTYSSSILFPLYEKRYVAWLPDTACIVFTLVLLSLCITILLPKSLPGNIRLTFDNVNAVFTKLNKHILLSFFFLILHLPFTDKCMPVGIYLIMKLVLVSYLQNLLLLLTSTSLWSQESKTFDTVILLLHSKKV